MNIIAFKNELVEKLNKEGFIVEEYENSRRIVVEKRDKRHEFQDYEEFLDEFGIYLI